MALASSINAAIERFSSNENRVDIFVNQDGYYTTNETVPRQVETLPSLMQRLQTRYLNIVDMGDWVTSTVYAINDVVKVSTVFYLCVEGHTSGVFATDLTANKWVVYQGDLRAVDLAGTGAGKGAELVGYLPQGSGAVATTVDNKLRESVSILDFMTEEDKTANYTSPGSVDVTYAFNAMWQHIKASLDVDTANLQNVSVSATIPHGVYYINSSVNWTNVWAWNIHIDMRGAKVVAGSGVSGKPLIDATNVRGLHIDGGYIESTTPAANAPSCGILLGPQGTLTCGNNSFRDLKIMGVFKVAPYINIGSETTYHYNCYFAQTNTDTNTYAYVGDGLHSNTAVTSDYTALRGNGAAVSFTNNKFYGCHFRNYGGGSAVYLSVVAEWMFDSGCYILAFGKSNFEIYQTAALRNGSLSIGGLLEAIGTLNAITFIVPDGEISGLAGFKFETVETRAGTSIFNMANASGAATTGTLNLSAADIRISGRYGTAMLFNNCANLTISGEIRYRKSAGLNLYDIKKFVGVVHTEDGSKISGTPGANVFNYMLIDESTYAGQVLAVSKGPTSYLGVQNGARPVIRAEGAAEDIDLMLQGKGTGNIRFGTLTVNADAPITGYITIKDAAGNVRKLAVIA